MDILLLSFAGAAILVNAYAYSSHQTLRSLRKNPVPAATAQETARREKSLSSIAEEISRADEAKICKTSEEAIDRADSEAQSGFETLRYEKALPTAAAPSAKGTSDYPHSDSLLFLDHEVSPKLIAAVESTISKPAGPAQDGALIFSQEPGDDEEDEPEESPQPIGFKAQKYDSPQEAAKLVSQQQDNPHLPSLEEEEAEEEPSFPGGSTANAYSKAEDLDGRINRFSGLEERYEELAREMELVKAMVSVSKNTAERQSGKKHSPRAAASKKTALPKKSSHYLELARELAFLKGQLSMIRKTASKPEVLKKKPPKNAKPSARRK